MVIFREERVKMGQNGQNGPFWADFGKILVFKKNGAKNGVFFGRF